MLPFDIVDDPIFEWGFDFCGFDRKRVADRVTFLSKEWSDKTAGIFNTRTCFNYVRWVDEVYSITNQHHICFILNVESQIIYCCSIVATEKTPAYIRRETLSVIGEVVNKDAKVLPCIADNVRNMQAALRKIAKKTSV